MKIYYKIFGMNTITFRAAVIVSTNSFLGPSLDPLFKLPNLRSLNLSHTDVMEIPRGFKNMRKL